MGMQNVEDVIDNYSGNARKVLEYSMITKRLLDEAKQPGFSVDSWAPLGALIDTANFIRVGNFKEVMDWASYSAFLTNWAMHSEWECSFKRLTDAGDVVLLELEERSRIGDHASVVNSVSVYEFNAEGKIDHVDIYLQMPLPDPSMFASYEGIAISE